MTDFPVTQFHETGNAVIDDLIGKAAAGDSMAAATVALTHATLLLAEQQRIANLIAFHSQVFAPNGDQYSVRQSMYVEDRAPIEKALGL